MFMWSKSTTPSFGMRRHAGQFAHEEVVADAVHVVEDQHLSRLLALGLVADDAKDRGCVAFTLLRVEVLDHVGALKGVEA